MRKAIKICLWWVSALAVTAVVASQSLPGCPEKCGQVEIPYPFGVGVQSGTGNNCFFEHAFHVDCKNSTLFNGNVEISSISLQGHMDMYMPVSRVCFNDTGGAIGEIRVSLLTSVFIISSSENKFLSVGCDTYGYLNSFQNNRSYSTGCLTRCNGVPDQQSDGTCSGIGCCQVDVPLGMRNISIEAYSFNSQRKTSDFNNCSYAFVSKEGWFNFSTADLRSLLFEKAPLVVDWAISHGTCESERTSPDYACKSNTLCVDSGYGFGYRCRCKPGFEGNPYLPDGCRDIDECKESAHNCTSEDNCRNTVGSYECYCPRAYTGTGTKEAGCHPPWRRNPLTILLVVASVGLVVLFVSMAWLYLIYQKRKLMKQRDRFFRQNGGAILQQKLSVKQGPSSLTAKIFTAQELIKATDNFHDSLVIGRGGFGTVYKGILPDNTVVAIKKSKLVDQSQIEQFVNEVIILSQINHRNVVKLLGCCLETEVPLLVYEFVNNGTLFESIHDKSKASVFTWETRLRVAAEVAGALSYLHSAASIPIIHRDVKSANILLDETCTAKVSDFGASRLIALDQVELATMVQGTFGYLDPEYMQTNQLTEKSDVYSFGVVILEILTGRKALLFDGPEEERSLAMHFLSSLDEGRLFEVVERGMVSDGNKKAVNEVAVLAARCLRLKGEERPSMKEVAMELEGIRMTGKHPWSSKHLDAEESHSLLPQPSRFTKSVDSIIDRGLFDLDEYGR